MALMEILKTKILSDSQFSQINQLWNDEYPQRLKDRFGILLADVENFNHYLIEDEKKNIIAWAVDFEKENEIRFSIIVGKDQQKKQLGSKLIKRLKDDLPEFYGWVINHNDDEKLNGEKYLSPMSFYLKHEFEVLEDIQIDNEMLRATKIRWKRHV
jgi:hypothetical protein